MHSDYSRISHSQYGSVIETLLVHRGEVFFQECEASSAFNNGLETFRFEAGARFRRGLRIGIRAYLDSIVFIRAGRDDIGGEFLLL